MILLTVICFSVGAFAQVPAANCQVQNEVKPGDTFTVTISINKCDLACYAQYQQLLPECFAATEISGKSDNANFYFENGKVFYQWYKLPVDKGSIELQYSIKVSDGAKPGTYQLPGYFSYQTNSRLGEISTSATVEIKQ